MTCLLMEGGSYPLTTAVMVKPADGKGCKRCGAEKAKGHGRRTCDLCQPPSGPALCYSCHVTPIHGRGARYCDECLPLMRDMVVTRKIARERATHGLRCRGCDRAKPHGRGRVYCDHCVKARKQPKTRVCERCPNATATPASKLCVECKAKAKAFNAEYKRQWSRDNPSPPSGPKALDVQRMGKRLQRDRDGHELTLAPRILVGDGHRPDSMLFPSLPVGPLMRMVHGLIRRTALDSTYSVDVLRALTGDDGQRRAPEVLHREGAPSVREAVCDRLGIPSRRLYNWEHGVERSASFDTVDKVLQRGDWLWWMVYEPCASGCEGVHGPPCLQCHGHMLARRAFEGE